MGRICAPSLSASHAAQARCLSADQDAIHDTDLGAGASANPHMYCPFITHSCQLQNPGHCQPSPGMAPGARCRTQGGPLSQRARSPGCWWRPCAPGSSPRLRCTALSCAGRRACGTAPSPLTASAPCCCPVAAPSTALPALPGCPSPAQAQVTCMIDTEIYTGIDGHLNAHCALSACNERWSARVWSRHGKNALVCCEC